MAASNTQLTDVSNNPLCAVVPDGGSVVTLFLFDKSVACPCKNSKEAARFAQEWNIHFDTEWACVLETSTNLMQKFSEALVELGVGQAVLLAAMSKVCGDVSK